MADFAVAGKGLRSDWKVKVPALQVVAAAMEQQAHHLSRQEWWENQQAIAEKDLRENGVEMREQPITGGNRLQAILDPERSRRVEECRGKVESHRQRAEEYQAYIHTLNLIIKEGEGTVELGVSDVQFFRM